MTSGPPTDVSEMHGAPDAVAPSTHPLSPSVDHGTRAAGGPPALAVTARASDPGAEPELLQVKEAGTSTPREVTSAGAARLQLAEGPSSHTPACRAPRPRARQRDQPGARRPRIHRCHAPGDGSGGGGGAWPRGGARPRAPVLVRQPLHLRKRTCARGCAMQPLRVQAARVLGVPPSTSCCNVQGEPHLLHRDVAHQGDGQAAWPVVLREKVGHLRRAWATVWRTHTTWRRARRHPLTEGELSRCENELSRAAHLAPAEPVKVLCPANHGPACVGQVRAGQRLDAGGCASKRAAHRHPDAHLR